MITIDDINGVISTTLEPPTYNPDGVFMLMSRKQYKVLKGLSGYKFIGKNTIPFKSFVRKVWKR